MCAGPRRVANPVCFPDFELLAIPEAPGSSHNCSQILIPNPKESTFSVDARFYAPAAIPFEQVTLDLDESHHFSHVLRGQIGAEVTLFDGLGGEFPATIIGMVKDRAVAQVNARKAVDREPELALTLAVALPKGDRQKVLVEKLTELGVAQWIPLITHRSVARPTESGLNRLRHHVVAACKQSGRNRLMEIAAPRNLDALAAEPGRSGWVAHPGSHAHFDWNGAGTGPLLVVIGPEGGFTDAEIQLLVERGFQVLSLGPRLLRVETAAIAIAAKLLLASPGGLS